METRFIKNHFIITPMKGTNICFYFPSMRWVLGNAQTISTFVESLSSIVHKPNKNMLCDNENNQSYNSECNNETNQK